MQATTSGMLAPNMPWLPRFLLPLWERTQRWLPRRRHLIFIEQPQSWWDYLDGDGAIQLHLSLHVTNESNTDAVIVSRVQVRLAGWKFLLSKDPWQDCMMVDVGKQRLTLGYVGDPLPPRTTTAVRIIHHYKSERPKPKQPIKCLLRITDQHRRFHSVRLTVPAMIQPEA
jgi:hypothetical protein